MHVRRVDWLWLCVESLKLQLQLNCGEVIGLGLFWVFLHNCMQVNSEDTCRCFQYNKLEKSEPT